MKDYIVMVIPVAAEPFSAVWPLPGDEDGGRLYAALNARVKPILGGPLEHVNVYWDFHRDRDFRYLDMFVHDTGRIDGMPVNALATDIYRNNVRIHEPARLNLADCICGPAVLFEEKVWR